MFVATKLQIGNWFNTWRVMLVCTSYLAMTGCAVMPESAKEGKIKDSITIAQTGATNTTNTDMQGWWQAGFYRPYQEEEEPMWHLDTLIAYNVIKPILDDNQDLTLWRFHRRAAEDNSGHTFSFIFYCTRGRAEKIYQRIAADPLVKELLSDHFLKRLTFYDINRELRPDIEATSDKKWAPELQKAWPYFIMGVSRTWLGLIEQYYLQQHPDVEQNLAGMMENFRQVSDNIDKLWESQGGHAFLHHLNALFAYQELYIVERRPMRF